MSSTEPPSRNSPRNQPHDTKSARDELSSKGKVEKVREIDADEQARKQKFLKFYKDDQVEEEKMNGENYPRPYDLYSGQETTKPLLGDSDSVGGDVQDAIVPAPSYAPPPNVNAPQTPVDTGAEAASTGALPQSEDFWEEFDLPDQPMPPPNFQETTNLSQKSGPDNTYKSGKQTTNPGAHPFSANRKESSEKKGPEPSPFGPPGKATGKEAKSDGKQGPFMKNPARKEEPKLPSPFEPPMKNETATRPLEKEEERTSGPVRDPIKTGKRAPNTTTTKEDDNLIQGLSSTPFQSDEREGGEKRGGQDKNAISIDNSMQPSFAANIQPMAVAATTQAAPYLSPTTMNLFFQMVGTMYIMAGPQGISTTEIVLNNPAFADSKFFGSTITIEKYATAPDSFNIRLTGSNAAVVSFKENIPSLMSAFQNGNFAFKVNRLDVEYSIEKPVFRRKEKGEDKGGAGSGDFGERRK